ncbi:MAG: metallophosphoesterase [Spirochaetota bacterium]
MRLNRGRHILAISDIHGADNALEAILNEIKKYDCQTIFLGDMLDKGNSSPGVISRLIEWQKERPEVIFLTGNHELLFFESLETGIDLFAINSAISQYRRLGGVPDDHLRFLKNLKPYHESKSFTYVHAGIEKQNLHLPIQDHPVEELVWTYESAKEWKGKRIVRGHRVVKRAIKRGEVISIDTGISCGGFLSAAILDDSAGKLIGDIRASNSGDVKKQLF